MSTRKGIKLHWLQSNLPEGLVVDAPWLTANNYSTKLRSKYLAAGWLKQPTARVYQRHSAPTPWQQVVISLQTLLKYNLVVSGLTALEHHGLSHFAKQTQHRVCLSGPDRPPPWLKRLPAKVAFHYRNDKTLFNTYRATTAPHELDVLQRANGSSPQQSSPGMHIAEWGPWPWPLYLSTPERAILELVNELPNHESFHHVDNIMSGLSTLSPRKLNTLLTDCRSIKAKRLFLFLAKRHHHAWFKHIEQDALELGTGNRTVVKGGRLDTTYLITVPGDLDGL